MNNNLKFIFEMIAYVVRENSPEPTEPKDVNWEYIFSVAEKHNISNLIGYCLKKNGFSCPEGIKNVFIQRLYQLALVNESQMNDINLLFDSLENQNISFMSLKGTDIKALYPSEDMRVMGDADILIHTDDYKKIHKIMCDLGFSFVGESNHEYNYRKEPITKIELHKFMIPSYNNDLYAYYGDGWKLAKPLKDGLSRFVLSNEDNFIYILSHFAKHYRDAGAGIKYVIDIWLYKKKVPELDTEYIKKQLENLGLADFYYRVVKLTTSWFENAEWDEITAKMTEFIVDSGVHGSKQHRALSETAREYMNSNIEKAEKNRYLRTVFPTLEYMATNYPILRKAPLMLPFFWVGRLLKGVLFKRKNISYHLERANSINSESLEKYVNHMNSVGLDVYKGRK